VSEAQGALTPLFSDSKGRDVPAPDLGGAPAADTHAHLDMLEDPTLALARAALAGVSFVATVADPTEDAWRTFDELPAWLAGARDLLREAGSEVEPPHVRVILGAHPHNAKDFDAEAEVELLRLAEDTPTSAIGEIGLDFHYDHSPREVQRAVFRRQLELARDLGLPAVVHLREAHEEGAEIMTQVGLPAAGCVLHCFTGDAGLAARFLDLGCTAVSFAGPVTFKKADEIRAAATSLPIEVLLTETDCPFMTPEPFRGRKNEPAFTVFTTARIAEARGEGLREFALRVYANALALFDIERA
jgi:TatD DNase family protein